VIGTLRTLFAVVRKELLQVTRDRRMLFMILVAPVIQIIAFGYAANLAFEHADVVVVDEDHTEESRAFVRELGVEGTFHIVYATTVAEAEGAVRDGEAQIAMVVPRDFGKRTTSGLSANVQVLLDGSDPSRGLQAGYAVEAYATARSARMASALGAAVLAQMAGVPRVVLVPRLLYNPALKGRIFMVPGTAASILIIVTTIVTAMGFAREREMGTLEQLLVTPIDPLVLMVGKIIPYACFGLADASLILIVGNELFDVPIRGSLPLALLAVSLYLVTTLGTGLMISTLARTQQQALMAGFFFLLPALLLSGFMTPVDAMPAWIRPVSYVNPMRWFLEVWRTVLLRGGTFGDVAFPLAAQGVLATFVMGFATVRFRKTVG
jgi:ABC-2 type transport system permease protein